jgi:cytochrome c peroxidase
MRHAAPAVFLCALLTLVGCQRAGRYGGKAPRRDTPKAEPTARTADAPPAGVPAEFAWQEPAPALLKPEAEVPIVFVSADSPEWNKLPAFWNETAEGKQLKRVAVKVPLGLENPSASTPESNPPTLGKWQLGKDLFYARRLLGGEFSCASCHTRRTGFTSPFRTTFLNGKNAPTLINVVYNTHQFWDGRATALEEVVQRSLADELPPGPGEQPRWHSWPGVIRRLRTSDADHYRIRFRDVFGTEPTQDAVGKALATFMRTILVGDSVFDRALQAQKDRNGATLDLPDFSKAMPERPEAEVKSVHAGYRLFYNLGDRKANCVKCHGGHNFTDNGFHNLGVGDSGLIRQEPGREAGHFPYLPVGQKDRRLIGAMKTPTLRGLPRTGPYFHDGSASDLLEVIWVHNKGGKAFNSYLDAEFFDPEKKQQRVLNLSENEAPALEAFLKALDGGPLHERLAEEP